MARTIKPLKQGRSGIQTRSGSLNVSEALSLGKWYHKYANEAKTVHKIPLLEKAKACFDRFLVVQTAKTLDRAAIEVKVKQIGQEIAAIEESMGPKKDWPVFTGEPLILEAEKATFIFKPMRVVTAGTAIGKRCVVHPPTFLPGEATTGRVVFHIESEKACRITLWARVRAPSYRYNDIDIAFAPGKVKDSSNFYSWYLTVSTDFVKTKFPYSYSSHRFQKGMNTVIIRGDDPGVSIDQIMITEYSVGSSRSRSE